MNHALQPLSIPLPDHLIFFRPQFLVGRLVIQQILVHHHILPRVEHDAFRLRAVPAGAARLLIIVLHTLRHIKVQHITHIGLVNAHAESIGGHDHRLSVIDEILLVFAALLSRQAGVVSGCGNAPGLQSLMYLLHILAGGTVDDSAVPGMALYVLQQKIHFIFGCFHAEIEILAVESADQQLRLSKAQHGNDVILYLSRGRGCERADHRSSVQLFDKRDDFQIAGPEILPPLGNAVGLVHCHHTDPGPLGKAGEVPGFQTLRGHIDDLIPAAHGVLHGSLNLSLRQGAVDIGSMHSRLVQGLDLILHQGNQRGNHHRNARQHQRWDLVADGFSRSSRHDAQHVPPGQYAVDQQFLAGTKIRVSKICLQNFMFLQSVLSSIAFTA